MVFSKWIYWSVDCPFDWLIDWFDWNTYSCIIDAQNFFSNSKLCFSLQHLGKVCAEERPRQNKAPLLWLSNTLTIRSSYLTTLPNLADALRSVYVHGDRRIRHTDRFVRLAGTVSASVNLVRQRQHQKALSSTTQKSELLSYDEPLDDTDSDEDTGDTDEVNLPVIKMPVQEFCYLNFLLVTCSQPSIDWLIDWLMVIDQSINEAIERTHCQTGRQCIRLIDWLIDLFPWLRFIFSPRRFLLHWWLFSFFSYRKCRPVTRRMTIRSMGKTTHRREKSHPKKPSTPAVTKKVNRTSPWNDPTAKQNTLKRTPR